MAALDDALTTLETTETTVEQNQAALQALGQSFQTAVQQLIAAVGTPDETAAVARVNALTAKLTGVSTTEATDVTQGQALLGQAQAAVPGAIAPVAGPVVTPPGS